MSAWELPTTVMVAGSSFAIRSDFRAVLDALAALTDPDLTQQEQYVACLQILYPRWKELPDANAALRAAFTFINEGKEDEQQGFNYKLQFGPGLDRKEYARLWDKLTEPVEFHEVTVPDEDGDYTFTAYFSNVGDELLRKKAEKNYWKNLTANFIAQKPART